MGGWQMLGNKRIPHPRVPLRAAICAATLIFAPLSLGAQMVRPNPDPGNPYEGFVDYVGHYGEVFKLRGSGNVKGEMYGEAEIISLFPRFRADGSNPNLLFEPKTSDFAPEDFSRDALTQLIILPWSSSPHRSLAEVRRAKIADLRKSDVGFQVNDSPFFGGPSGSWSEGTFEVHISTPYKLTQLYTASPAYLCILTSGVDEPPSTFIRWNYGWLRAGLREWIVPASDPLPLRRGATQLENLRTTLFSPVVWMSWAGICGVCCLLAAFCSATGYLDRIRRISIWLLVFANVGAIVGIVVGFSLGSYDWAARRSLSLPAIDCFLLGLFVLLIAGMRRPPQARGSTIATVAWAIASSITLAALARLETEMPVGHAPYLPVYGAFYSFVCWGIGGFIFGALDGPKKRFHAANTPSN